MQRHADGRGRKAAWVIIAVVASLGGFAASSARAKACTCAPRAWRAHLQSVTSSDPVVDHTPFWPEQAFVSDHGVADGALALNAGTSEGRVRRLETTK